MKILGASGDCFGSVNYALTQWEDKPRAASFPNVKQSPPL